MGDAAQKAEPVPALVRMTGPLAGTRYELSGGVVRIGRAAENDVVITGADAVVVSAHHAEVSHDGAGWRIRDLDSTNGTFIDGIRVSDAALKLPSTIQLGKGGPDLRFTAEETGAGKCDVAETVAVTMEASEPGRLAAAGLSTEHDRALRRAVARARVARHTGALNQTAAIMREAFASAIRGSNTRFKRIIAGLAAVLVVVSGLGAWRIHDLTQSKRSIDRRIVELERRLAEPVQTESQADQIIDELSRYETEALALQQNPLYRLGTRRAHEDFLTSDIRSLLAEFGADSYSIPPEFVDAVRRYIAQYQGPDRPNMARAMSEARPAMNRIRQVLEENNLPPDFAYMVLVESALDLDQKSRAGCAGLWQFTSGTARAYGLRVSGDVDERLNPVKETQAACKYIRNLILDFGAGTSVMLALAAYNVGPSRVKQAIHRAIDPIKQRNFWYLYRIRALPLETREYVPKVFAAMVIGRHPEKFGFGKA